MSFPNLRNFWESIKRDKILLLILLLGFTLRTTNPTFGSPSLYISNDEAIAHFSAWNMLAQRSLVSIANYTPLGAYIQIPFLIASFLTVKFLGLVANLREFELFVLTHEGYFLFIPRIISGFFGTMTILLIYKITSLLFNLRGEKKLHLGGDSNTRSVALIAAFLGAVSFNLVHISHFGRPWAAALFFFLLAVYWTLKQKLISSYLAVGLSYGFHQVGIFSIPLVLLISKKLLTIKNLLGMALMSTLILILSSLTLKVGIIKAIEQGQSFLKSDTIITDFLSGNYNLFKSLSTTISNNLSVYFILNFLITDGIILIFGIWGIFRVLGHYRSKKILISYLFFYFLFASFFFQPLLRYLLPMLLLLIPFAAYGLYDAFLSWKPKNQKYIGWTLVSVALILASINSLWWNWFYLQKPTFIQAYNWFEENVPAETPIAYLGGRYQTFIPNATTIRQVQKINSSFYSRLLTILPAGNFDNVRNIIYVSNFPGNNKLEQLKNATVNYPVKYLVDYYLDPGDRIYNLAPQNFNLVTHFNPVREDKIVGIPEPLFDASANFKSYDLRDKASMYQLSRTGPIIDILEVKNY